MENVLLLFSGGKDSFIAACRELTAGNRVLLISFNNSAVLGEKNILHGVARLQRKYGANRISYAGCYNTGAIIQCLKTKWADLSWAELGASYPHLTNAQMTCTHCQTAMWISAIAYVRAKGISVIAAGHKQSDPFCTGFDAYHKQIQGLAHENYCKIRFPVLDDGVWANSPEEVNRDYEMARYGFMPAVYEPQCMLGRPVPPMSSEMKKDMDDYFEKHAADTGIYGGSGLSVAGGILGGTNMNRIDIRFALAAVLLTKFQTCPLADIRFTLSEVIGIGSALEEKSGKSVVNGFTPKQAEEYLSWSRILQSDSYCNHEELTFRVNTENPLIHGAPVPEQAIIDALDPPINYGIKVLQAANIFTGIYA